MTDLSNDKAYEAVLFDLDGTLVDSIPLHFQAYTRVLGEFGIDIDFKPFLAAASGPARETIPKLLAGRSCPLAVDEIHARKKEIAARLFEETPPQPLATAQLLPVLGAHYPLGLVSSGSRRSVELTLKVMGWQDVFRVVISGDDVDVGKPSPEGYLRAAETLNASPAACLVFEDMDAGVAAARAAGMEVIDVRTNLPVWRRSLEEGS